MSNITTVYNALKTALADKYPTKTRIPNPYRPDQNAYPDLVDGYGLIVGAAEYEPHDFCTMMINHVFGVILTLEVVQLESEFTDTDAVTLALKEAVCEIQKLFYSYDELGVQDAIAAVDISSVSGLEPVQTDKGNIVQMTANFIFKIKEPI